MDPYVLILLALVAVLLASVRMAGGESRRRKEAYAAYYSYDRVRPTRAR